MINILYLHAGAEMYGADKVLLELITGLDKSIYNPVVVLPEKGPLCTELKRIGVDVTIVPYPILRRRYFNFKGLVNYLIELKRYTKELRKIVEANKISLIHSNTLAVLEGWILAKELKIPHIWEVHEIIESPAFFNKFTCRLLKDTTLVVAVSQAVKQHLMNSKMINNDLVRVIYNGVDSSRFRPGIDTSLLRNELSIPESASVVGMIGRVNSWKGQEDLVKAANHFMGEMKDAYLVIVGSAFRGEEWRKEALGADVARSPYADRMRVLDYRSDTEVLYNLFDVLVLPSIRPDPLPTVVLEAMSSGIPVVGYRHGGICEMVDEGENGFLVNVKDIDGLARKIGYLLREDEIRARMGKASRDILLSTFSLDAYISSFSATYMEVIDCEPSFHFL